MKQIYILICMVLVASSLFGELSFYGEYSTEISAAIPQEGYDTPLNPGNLMGVKDTAMNHSLTAKFSGRDELASLELWFGLREHTLAQTGEIIPYFDLKRAAVSWSVAGVGVRLGRQSMLTGYGYGWNPMDFANPLKNPGDPQADLKGVDGLQLHLFPYAPVNLQLYVLMAEGALSGGADYQDLMVGGELTGYFPYGEIKVTALYDYDQNSGEDPRTTALGGGFLVDWSGVGIYGEAGLREGSRNLFADDPGNPSGVFRKEDWLPSGLLGVEYTFPSELSASGEVFYNGEGYSLGERRRYFQTLETSFSESLLEMYRPGYFSRIYALVNLMYPLYSWSMSLGGLGLYSVDSGALSLLPSLHWTPSGALTLEFGYSGIFSLRDEEWDEAELSPVTQAVSLKGVFSY